MLYDPSLHTDKKRPKQARPVGGGAASPVASAADEDAQPMADDNAEGLCPGAVTPRGLWLVIALRSLWLGGAANPVACGGDDAASVGSITEGARLVANAP